MIGDRQGACGRRGGAAAKIGIRRVREHDAGAFSLSSRQKKDGSEGKTVREDNDETFP